MLDPEHRVTPIDHGEVCLNYDKAWFASRGLAPPRDLVDVTLPRYRDLLVVENPATSTPGLAFMLGHHRPIRRPLAGLLAQAARQRRARRGRLGGGVHRALLRRRREQGKRPIVVSYASSPPAEVIFRDPRPAEAPTGVVEDVLPPDRAGRSPARRDNEEGARELIDFMLSTRFQEDIPLQMFVFPARWDAALPPAFVQFAVVPERRSNCAGGDRGEPRAVGGRVDRHRLR